MGESLSTSFLFYVGLLRRTTSLTEFWYESGCVGPLGRTLHLLTNLTIEDPNKQLSQNGYGWVIYGIRLQNPRFKTYPANVSIQSIHPMYHPMYPPQGEMKEVSRGRQVVRGRE